MQRTNFILSVCATLFGTLFLLQCVRQDFSSRVETKLRGQSRVLYNNYLWQRDDDDGYFANENSTGYYSNNSNYKAQGNSNNLGGGSYVQSGYNGSSYTKNSNSNTNGDDDGSSNTQQGDDDSIKQESYFGWFGALSPSQSAFLGVGIGLLLLSMIGCCLYGPALWALLTNWLFNRKNKDGKVLHNFSNLGDF
jgi:hypothetical protein